MRFFMDCVSCWRPTMREVAMTEEAVSMAATPTRGEEEEEETKSLMPADKAAASRTKMNRERVGSMNPQWKPSLCSITEDSVVAENGEKTLLKIPTRTPTVVNRKNSPGSLSNVRARTYSNDTGRKSVPVFLPTFSPTPFMF
ncbi:uncharacterized protein LOC120126701 [Hibiscus syriacus]|uniref:uncharacterized protein LOC120126701 n=1 Tax=Hibiscus syriacus TaxID=106335 RepID=UPI001922AA11|nr:uncharacterized protein LOC120126701 [Hibiscus syriacus]